MPIPTTLDGKAIYPALAQGANIVHCGNQIILNSYLHPSFYWTNGWDVLAAFNEDTGSLTWIKNYTYPEYPFVLPWQDTWSHGNNFISNGILIQFNLHDWTFQGIKGDTGNVVWTTQLDTGWGDGKPHVYGEIACGITRMMTYNDHLYVITFAGEIWDVDATNGNIMWYTNTTNLMGPSGIETPYGLWPRSPGWR